MIEALSIAALVVSVMAIALSLMFFRWSSDSARRIESAVEKLEVIFDKLYEGMFSMTRDTMSAMTANLLPSQQRLTEEVADHALDKRIEDLDKKLEEELSSLVGRIDFTKSSAQEIKDELLGTLRKEFIEGLESSLESVKEVKEEIKEEEIKQKIVRIIEHSKLMRKKLTLYELLEKLVPIYDSDDVLMVLDELVSEDIVSQYPSNVPIDKVVVELRGKNDKTSDINE